MPLSVGDRLGPYEILAPIGAGGMGEVYKARDTRLERVVAVKVSKEEFTERFTREARSIAALNHSNICHLYDVGPNYLVMEYVEGETLKGPMPLDEAMPIINQLIDGIEAAHERNVVHRDLKPANIKITPEGVAKILDFGLARAADPAPEGSAENSPTLTMNATQAGTILGTAAYMSPEQAKGKTADRRSDIWSFGVIVYELLTGKRPFEGETVVETLGAVLNKEPDWTPVPERMRRLLQRCLKKDRKQRLGAIGDARWMMEESATSTANSSIMSTHSRFVWLAWSLAAVGIVALGISLINFREHPLSAPELARFQIPLPDRAAPAGFPDPSISPDGHRLVFPIILDGITRLWVRSLDQLEARPLTGTEGAAGLQFWSPDSRFIVFSVAGTLKKIEASGGPPQTLCKVPGPILGGFWTSDGRIVFGTVSTGLFQVAAAGGAPSPLTVLDAKRQDISHAFPVLLPDGQHFLYRRYTSNPETSGIYLGALAAGTSNPNAEQQAPKRLLPDVSSVVFATSLEPRSAKNGQVLFSREGTLMAQRFNSARLEFSGEAVPIAEQVAGNGDFTVSSTGILVYATRAGASGGNRLTWYDRQGKRMGTSGAPGVIGEIELAPDGTRVAVVRDARSVWVDELSRGVSNRITPPETSVRPVWSPDGNRIIVAAPRDVFIKASSNAGNEEVLFKFERPTEPLDWSRDGRWLLYAQTEAKMGHDLWVLPMREGKPAGKPVVFLQTSFDEREGKFSPDGRFVAYVSDESGRYEVYVASFPSPAFRVAISNGGGYQPRWSRDGKELLYFTGDSKLMSVDVMEGATFKVGVPKFLFEVPIYGGGASQEHRWDMTTDGKRFLITTVGGDVSAPLTLVENWTSMLHN